MSHVVYVGHHDRDKHSEKRGAHDVPEEVFPGGVRPHQQQDGLGSEDSKNRPRRTQGLHAPCTVGSSQSSRRTPTHEKRTRKGSAGSGRAERTKQGARVLSRLQRHARITCVQSHIHAFCDDRLIGFAANQPASPGNKDGSETKRKRFHRTRGKTQRGQAGPKTEAG